MDFLVVLNPWDSSCNRTHTQVGPQWSLYLYEKSIAKPPLIAWSCLRNKQGP